MRGVRQIAQVATACGRCSGRLSMPSAPGPSRPAKAQGRPAEHPRRDDRRPGRTADVAHMPNVKRLLAEAGHDLRRRRRLVPALLPRAGDLHHRPVRPQPRRGRQLLAVRLVRDEATAANILPAWLQKAGYRTALIGKWLNGYGARDAHGEVPKGFDIWRGLLDVSAYDYYNFVMNRNGKLKSWGDADFARKLVEFANIEVIDRTRAGWPASSASCTTSSAPPPYSYWGSAEPEGLLARRDRAGSPSSWSARSASSKKPFFIWWAPAAPHREDVAVDPAGPPRRRPAPRPALRRAEQGLQAAPAAELQRGRPRRQAVQHDASAPKLMTQQQIDQLQLDYEGRIGSLLAVDDHVKQLVGTLRQTGQLKNTLIVFVSDNGWLQGQHRITGRQVPPLRGVAARAADPARPGRAGRPGRCAGRSRTSTSRPRCVDAAKAKAGRRMDGVSLLPTLRNPRKRPNRDPRDRGARPALPRQRPGQRMGPPLLRRAHRPLHVRRSTRRRASRSSTTASKDPYQLTNVAADPAYAGVKSKLAAALKKLSRCRGRSCNVAP